MTLFQQENDRRNGPADQTDAHDVGQRQEDFFHRLFSFGRAHRRHLPPTDRRVSRDV